ncbi:hypothetical protein D3C79_931680 [compost metagenome]
MTSQRETLSQALQPFAITAAYTDPVVRGAFEKVHGTGGHGQQLRQQRPAQTKAGALQGKGCAHGVLLEATTLPGLSAQGG